MSRIRFNVFSLSISSRGYARIFSELQDFTGFSMGYYKDERMMRSVVFFQYIRGFFGDTRDVFLKKKQNAPRPSEHPPARGGKMSKRLGGIKGCKYKTSSWHLNGFPDGNNIGSTV